MQYSAPIVVLHSTYCWLPLTQTWMYNLVSCLPGYIENHIVCQTTQNLPQFQVPNIHCLQEISSWQYFWERVWRKLQLRQHLEFFVQQARDHQARILHTHFGNLGWANIAVAEKASMKRVVTFYGRDVNQIPRQDSRWHTRYKELFTHVDLVLCEGPYMKHCIIELGCPEDKVLVQHIGVRLDELNYQPREWDGQRPLRVLMAASFREKKGFPYGLEALGQMSKVIPLEVTIIGDSDKSKSSQREKQRILDTISRYHLTSRVKLLGYQPFSRLLEEAYQHHVFLAPSVTASDGDTEGGAPVSIIEMAATGMPIVSTIHCDIPEIIQHGHTGLLAEERDVVGLVKQLRWLVEHPDKWIQMTSRARQRIEMEYNADIQGKNLGKLYESLLDK